MNDILYKDNEVIICILMELTELMWHTLLNNNHELKVLHVTELFITTKKRMFTSFFSETAITNSIISDLSIV